MQTRPQGDVRYENEGKAVLVTGGAKGIGRAVCELFAESGANVLSMDVDVDSPPSINNVEFVLGDTSNESDCEAAVARCCELFGGLDVLVNNAAIQPPSSYVSLHDLSQQEWQRMVDVNFTGYTLMAKHAVRIMREQGSGVIVNMASGQGHRTARQVPCYGPIKSGNLMQTMQWGVEYARQGIRVVSVSPGAILTPLVEASLKKQGGVDGLANRHPLGRIGAAEEVARAVLWLSSSHASFITGTDLQVDGGLGAFGAFAHPYTSNTTDNA